jgi:Secretion system C-terminal sorting domain
MFPNPASDAVFLRLPDDGRIDVVLLDLAGRQMRTWSGAKGPHVHLPIGELSKGIYWVRASNGTSTSNKKLILH